MCRCRLPFSGVPRKSGFFGDEILNPMTRATRVLLLSYAYEPGIGGIEIVSALLARALTDRQYDVRVVTVTPGESLDPNGVPVIRRPSPLRLLAEFSWADIVLQSNVSVTLAWPVLFRLVRRPWLVVNHTSIRPPGKGPRVRDTIKLRTLPKSGTFAVSQFLADEIPRSIGVLPNPYDEHAFPAPEAHAQRSRALLFVGRLERAKGVDVLIEALAVLAERGAPARAVLIGDGGERSTLEALAAERGLGEAIQFRGAVPPSEVGQAMRQHAVLVVPSRAEPPEAFGVVAIEGIASGAITVVSGQGGLPEAVGEAGIVVPPEDPVALADALSAALSDDAVADRLLSCAPAQLARHRIGPVADRYAAELERLLGGRRPGRG
jgi:glycogen(starch) synthase